MAMAGHCSNELRLPLTPMDQAKNEELRATLVKLGLI
jgi:4-hydroxy-tetrahydrodipicolinate synthase